MLVFGVGWGVSSKPLARGKEGSGPNMAVLNVNSKTYLIAFIAGALWCVS
jgi:hypothetical protein